jgi:hypothetical protein
MAINRASHLCIQLAHFAIAFTLPKLSAGGKMPLTASVSRIKAEKGVTAKYRATN